jgi:hypothetical protein
MIKHHLVQILPVAVKAMFCVRESFSVGRKKSLTPARTIPHFITGALNHRLLLASELGPPFCPPKQLSGLEGYADQKCTVFSPTSLVHNRWKMLCCAAGAPSTVGVPATVCWYRRKRLLRCWRRRKGARKVVNWWVRERKRRRVEGEDMVMGEEDWWCWL